MTLAVGQMMPSYAVYARNGATHSENKIHDDSVAREYGFAGGLVPGVTVHAYMTRLPVDAFGPEWLERGTISARFLKPFYEGELVTVSGTITRADAVAVEMELTATNPAGEACGIGTASLPSAAAEPPPLSEFPHAPLPERRPFATRTVFEGLDILGSLDHPWEIVERDTSFFDEVADDHPLYRDASGGLLHPGYLIRSANSILVRNVELGPWIHVSSDVTHFAAVRRGEGYTTRARVIDLFERKGHRFVVLDVLLAKEDGTPITRTRHTAIYDVRRVASPA